MTIESVRQAIRELAMCPVCRRPPALVDCRAEPHSADILIVARCHGSTDRARIPGFSFGLTSDRALDFVGTWLDGIFAADTLPDVMELIRYNNDPWKFPR